MTTFVDLGMSPPYESYILADQLNAMELFYALRALICHDCQLGQRVAQPTFSAKGLSL
jgi:hypothetical protein